VLRRDRERRREGKRSRRPPLDGERQCGEDRDRKRRRIAGGGTRCITLQRTPRMKRRGGSSVRACVRALRLTTAREPAGDELASDWRADAHEAGSASANESWATGMDSKQRLGLDGASTSDVQRRRVRLRVDARRRVVDVAVHDDAAPRDKEDR